MGRTRWYANAEQRQDYFCSGSLPEVPVCIECFNLISKMVFPLPNTTANRYCDYPRADTFFFGGGGGGGGPEAPLVSTTLFTLTMPGPSKEWDQVYTTYIYIREGTLLYVLFYGEHQSRVLCTVYIHLI